MSLVLTKHSLKYYLIIRKKLYTDWFIFPVIMLYIIMYLTQEDKFVSATDNLLVEVLGPPVP